MTTVRFIGTLPENKVVLAAVRTTFDRFSRVKKHLLDAGFKGLSDLEKDELAEKFQVDRFLVDDIIDVLNGSVKPLVDPYASGVFWTFGRRSPRWGMPWASITLDDTGACYLNIRWGGTFDDIEDPPRSVRCIVVLESTPGGTEDLLFSSAEFDCWVRIEGASVNGFLVTNRSADVVTSAC